MCRFASMNAISAATITAATAIRRGKPCQLRYPTKINSNTRIQTFGNSQRGCNGNVKSMYVVTRKMLSRGPDSSSTNTSGSRRMMNVYEAVLVESSTTAITNQAKSRRSLLRRVLVPRKRKATMVNEVNVRRKKNSHGALQRG